MSAALRGAILYLIQWIPSKYLGEQVLGECGEEEILSTLLLGLWTADWDRGCDSHDRKHSRES